MLAPSAKRNLRCPVSHMKGELHPTENRLRGGLAYGRQLLWGEGAQIFSKARSFVNNKCCIEYSYRGTPRTTVGLTHLAEKIDPLYSARLNKRGTLVSLSGLPQKRNLVPPKKPHNPRKKRGTVCSGAHCVSFHQLEHFLHKLD